MRRDIPRTTPTAVKLFCKSCIWEDWESDDWESVGSDGLNPWVGTIGSENVGSDIVEEDTFVVDESGGFLSVFVVVDIADESDVNTGPERVEPGIVDDEILVYSEDDDTFAVCVVEDVGGCKSDGNAGNISQKI